MINAEVPLPLSLAFALAYPAACMEPPSVTFPLPLYRVISFRQ